MIIHHSDMKALDSCAARAGFRLKGLPDQQNSAMAFGTVGHHALMTLEQLRSQGVEYADYVEAAVETFVFYWNPLNIHALTEPVPADGWIAGQTYMGMRKRGIDMIRSYADLIRFNPRELWALEYGFMVPIDGTWDEELGEPHILAGSLDQLAMKEIYSKPTLEVGDLKTGSQASGLRYNLQFTAYAYATTKREFWTGYRGEDGFGEAEGSRLYAKTKSWGRRGTWINLRTFKFVDAGWRGPIDYERFAIAVEQYVALVRADIFPLTLSGDTCPHCPYRAVCAGTGIAPKDHGNPRSKS